MTGKRKGTMSDDQRALVGREYRELERDGRVVDPTSDEDGYTPVPVSIVVAHAPMNLTAREQALMQSVWQHVANRELELRQLIVVGDAGAVSNLVDEMRVDHERFKADLTGADGTNGKVGTMRKALDKLLGRAWWLFTFAVGGIGAAAVKLVLVGRAYGELEAQVEASKARLQLLETVVLLKSQPAPTPEKATP